MKIGSLPIVAMEQYNSNKVRARKTEAPEVKADSLETTNATRLFSEALNAVRVSPEVRMDKVEAVRSQIASGTYRIDAAAVAARILAGVTGE
ncbi:MAG: flagellar biosynthesis anti-sigma factor FlgM [Oscillospiraceae bacterium]|nr:flagellar biosynthesis anti-sigma factor FlgM [Oscillospiraceae bacterium]